MTRTYSVSDPKRFLEGRHDNHLQFVSIRIPEFLTDKTLAYLLIAHKHRIAAVVRVAL